MKPAILFILLLPFISNAQVKLTGLGEYVIGVTAPDSMNSADFKEQEQAYAKGTVALPCNHIRLFKAATKTVEGISITNLALVFYDSKLFKISCTNTDELQRVFALKYGKSSSRTQSRLSFCGQGKNKIMLLQGEVWQNEDILALVIHAQGYNADCQQEQINRLTIGSQRVSALASDCELQSIDPFSNEFDDLINQSSSRTDKLKKKE